MTTESQYTTGPSTVEQPASDFGAAGATQDTVAVFTPTTEQSQHSSEPANHRAKGEQCKPSRHVLIVHCEARVRELWRESLTVLEDTEIIEAPDAHRVLNRPWAKAPDVVVVAGLNGIEVAREIVLRHPTIEVIVCGGDFGTSSLMESLRAGVRCHLPSEAPADLVDAVQSALRGKSYLTDQTRKLLTDMMLEEYVFRLRNRVAASDIKSLTPREREVLESLIRGKTNKEIACEFNISTHTAHTHRARILQKLNVHSVAELTTSMLLDLE
jgi:DNA-binding NarL/FixJ family response regulator